MHRWGQLVKLKNRDSETDWFGKKWLAIFLIFQSVQSCFDTCLPNFWAWLCRIVGRKLTLSCLQLKCSKFGIHDLRRDMEGEKSLNLKFIITATFIVISIELNSMKPKLIETFFHILNTFSPMKESVTTQDLKINSKLQNTNWTFAISSQRFWAQNDIVPICTM